MTVSDAVSLIGTSAWMESWADTKGHPDEQRHAAANVARQAAEEACRVIWRAGHAAGREEAHAEYGGQLSL